MPIKWKTEMMAFQRSGFVVLAWWEDILFFPNKAELKT